MAADERDEVGRGPAGDGQVEAAPPRVPGYEVLELLGRGSSAEVWRARRRGDGLVVALKVLTPARGDVAGGLREAGLLAGVRHRHVVSLHDVLALPDPGTGRPVAVALATQLAGGGSLAQVLSRRRILSPGELVTALQPVAGALADLHRQGVVHGDVSPGNLLFLSDGMPVLSDLGAARVVGLRPGELQGTGAPTGMVAPEVLEGFAPTPESDVYQLGALAWSSLAGAPPGLPWERGVLEELAPGLPDALPDLVERCLAPEPGDRPDAEEVALALLAVATPEPVEVAPDADPGHGVTERLRRQAQHDVEALAGAPGRRPLLHPLRRRPSARGGSHRPGRAEPRAGASPGTRALTVLIVLGLLATGLLAARPLLDGAGALVKARVGDEPVALPAPPPASPVPPTATPPGAPSEDLAEVALVVQQLVDVRAAAWESGEPATLGELAATGSPAWQVEAEALAELREEGVRYDDVSFTVLEAEVVGEPDGELGGNDENSEVTVDAVLSRGALRGADAQGRLRVDEPAGTERVQLVLRQQGGRWLVWSWSPGAAPAG